ncbi:DUF3624 domain-containing protein [Photobacterium sanguinicancri]|uniref:DUF3624 domain-containing protein n=1 Tax=Photobacterium sanguinicancri TaxID=875932 RepID=A0AAW7YAK2_9GAMM|nr:DUF3624 domain-containing protein [Photobacterium sanguinicancri]MDO6544950.1 DUF3624 domain-containing protein [Photobacterium sanguinicancri]
MACSTCRDSRNRFKQKLGRCHQCMWQLTLLSILSWTVWAYRYLVHPTSVESITLIFAASSFSLLLLAHLVVALKLKLNNNKT